MDHKEEENKIIPGIREALYPGLANGSSFTDDEHAHLLRSPDPVKILESFLAHEKTLHTGDHAEPEQLEVKTSPDESDDMSYRESHPFKEDLLEHEAEVVTENKEEESKADHPAEPLAKPVHFSGADAPQVKESPSASPLSPYTQWLKSLTGSEYVHPYDDDFALQQGGEDPGQGISETFAELLASQGYKDQAIAMYQRLMEKYPEKSGFFAAKIEALL